MPDETLNLLRDLVDAVNAYRDEHSNREAEGTQFPYLNNYPAMLIVADKVGTYLKETEGDK